MNDGQHPIPEVLGAFFEGRLEGDERAAVVAHMAACDLCGARLRGAAAARDEEERPAEGDVFPFRLRRWIFAAAAAVITAFGLAGGYAWFQGRDAGVGVQTLIAASPQTYRTIEPRLTGFRWAELRHLRDGDGARVDAEGLTLAGAAGEVLTETQNDPSADARRAAGVASLLVRETSRATPPSSYARRRAATRNTRPPGTISPRPSTPRRCSSAATPVWPKHSRRQSGRRSWRRRCLRRGSIVHCASGCARRRRRRGASRWPPILLRRGPRRRVGGSPRSPRPLRRVSAIASSRWKPPPAPAMSRAWRATCATCRRKCAAGSSGRPRPLGGGRAARRRRRRGDAAGCGAYSRWRAAEILRRDAARGRVEAIDGARGERRLHAARGHVGYRGGRLAYRDHKLPAAERELLAAAAELDAAGSPMGGMAGVYAASVIFDQNRLEEAATVLRPLVARSPETHLALRGQAAALLGRCSAYAGRWSEALLHRQAALAAFRRAGEPAQIAESEIAIGEIYSTVGEADRAWAHRLAALQILGDGNYGNRLLAALATHARGELRAGRRAAAGALLRLEIAEAQRVGDPLLIADAFKRRARLHADEDLDAAVRDLRDARAWAARAADSGLRSRFEAECALVEGVVDRSRDPQRSAARLTAAIDFARTTGDRRLLPEALLERARTHRAAGRDDAAWNDLAAAIDEVDERQITAASGAGAMFDAAEALFDEAVDLLLARGENERAFVYAERANARASLGASDRSASLAGPIPATELAPDTVLVQFALLPRSVAAFALTRRGLRVTRQTIDQAALESDVRTLREMIESRRPVASIRPLAARLHALLIAPLALEGGTSSLVIAGGRVLQSVPWAALWDAERSAHLIERATITVAPSVRAWHRHRARLAAMRDGEQLLLVTSDLRPQLDPLTDLRREIAAIEAVYPRRETLTDAEATPSRFLAAAARSDVVHHAGHARAGALLLGGDEDLAATDIAGARLTRTRLVVLAACNTLGDDGARLEGAPSLASAFLAAGVPTVVGTLWPVHDAHAASLFGALHERLRAGSSVAAALREAQLGMLRGRNAELAHPVAWAAAEVLGAAQ